MTYLLYLYLWSLDSRRHRLNLKFWISQFGVVSLDRLVWKSSLQGRYSPPVSYHFSLVISFSSAYQKAKTIRVKRVCLLPERFADTSLAMKEPCISNLLDAI